LSSQRRLETFVPAGKVLAAGFTVPPQIEERLNALVKHIEEKRELHSLPGSSSFQGAIDAVEADLAAGRTPTTEAL